MQVLIIGKGGREHALAWKMSQSEHVDRLYIAPGNAGTELVPKAKNIPIAPTEIDKLLLFAQSNKIAMTVVGPEAPLALGIVDRFNEVGLACFGPTKTAAQLETSKSFAKTFMQAHGIPTATFAYFQDLEAAQKYIIQQPLPIVIKADGLAAGKGVVIADNYEQAIQTAKEMLKDQRFGKAGSTIVIEQYLQGQEVSYIAMIDGKHILPFATSQDHKRRDVGDQGPNTGGMGAYSPAPIVTAKIEQEILTTIFKPVVQGFKQMQVPYSGFLYAGLMLTEDGPQVLEFNCRLGDPEAQTILMRLKSDLFELVQKSFTQELYTIPCEWTSQTAITVVLSAGGYPDSYQSGFPIYGLNELPNSSQFQMFHSGTVQNNQQFFTAGGRVLSPTCLADNLPAAKTKIYNLIHDITWDGMYFRTDIGDKAINQFNNAVAVDSIS